MIDVINIDLIGLSIGEGSSSTDNTFWAQYNVTTYELVLNAYTANKVIRVKYEDKIYDLVVYEPNAATPAFYFTANNAQYNRTAILRNNNTWVISNVNSELTANRQSEITNSDINYPSSKAVINYVSDQLEPIETKIEEVIGSKVSTINNESPDENGNINVAVMTPEQQAELAKALQMQGQVTALDQKVGDISYEYLRMAIAATFNGNKYVYKDVRGMIQVADRIDDHNTVLELYQVPSKSQYQPFASSETVRFILCSYMNTNDGANWGGFIGYSPNLERLDLRGFKHTLGYIYGINTPNLTWVDARDCHEASSDSFKWIQAFNAPNIRTFVGDTSIEDVIKYNEKVFVGGNTSFNIVKHRMLERNSLRAIINGLADMSESETKPVVTLASACYQQLTTEDLRIATDKGWSIASE